jgi:hypothetical protein
MAGSKSPHCPEKGAISGVDHLPFSKVDTTIIEAELFPRVKKTVFSSGEKAGERSSAGPEKTPGANNCGLFLLCAAHSFQPAPITTRSPTSELINIGFRMHILLSVLGCGWGVK